MDAVIVAGGFGTRLLPLTSVLPKALVPVQGKPVLERQIEFLVQNNITKIFITVHHLKESIKSYFGNGSDWSAKITYIEEDFPLGTAGSLFKLKGHLSDPFLVLYCDYYLEINLQKFIQFHQNLPSNKVASIITQPIPNPEHGDHFEVDQYGKVLQIITRPLPPLNQFKNNANHGIYILTGAVFNYLKPPPLSFEKDIFPAVIKSGHHQLFTYTTTEIIHDIGTPQNLQKINNYLQANAYPKS